MQLRQYLSVEVRLKMLDDCIKYAIVKISKGRDNESWCEASAGAWEVNGYRANILLDLLQADE